MVYNSSPSPNAEALSDFVAARTLDEGFNESLLTPENIPLPDDVHQREALILQLLATMPRDRLATFQDYIKPLLQVDIVGQLPTELSLLIFSQFTWRELLRCALVSKRWRVLADDPNLWKNLCHQEGWQWKHPSRLRSLDFSSSPEDVWYPSEDEGMGVEEGYNQDNTRARQGPRPEPISMGETLPSPPFPSLSSQIHSSSSVEVAASPLEQSLPRRSPSRPKSRHSAPGLIHARTERLLPDYKLLHQTRVLLHNRLFHASYRLSTLQTHGTPGGHTNTIYCLQLYTCPDTGVQTLFTGSKDYSIREWNLSTGNVERVIQGTHMGSVISLSAHDGYIASGGSDARVTAWNLTTDRLVAVLRDHSDGVLGVRLEGTKLVSCSKDYTVRVYSFPGLKPLWVFNDHHAAVNAVAVSGDLIVSASGDRSIKVRNAATGELVLGLEAFHSRGIASIDFKYPHILTGSSDRHIRLFDMSKGRGWSTGADYDQPEDASAQSHCEACGRETDEVYEAPLENHRRVKSRRLRPCAHTQLVRSVALGEDLVVSGSYDLTIKVWDRKSGSLVVDLAGAHAGRIFCVAFDCTKIISCGEDQKICIWDFSHGIDTSFIKL